LRKKERLEIPVKNIPVGITVCLENAESFCFDAKTLAEKSSLQHALGLCIYAVEELGKAELLKEKWIGSLETVVFKLQKPKVILKDRPSLKNWKQRGFRKNKEINPFYDHNAKLFFAQGFMKMASDNRLLNSLGKKKTYRNLKELFEDFEKLDDPAYINKTKTNGIRELAMYVDYDPSQAKWVNGIPKITVQEITEIIVDIQTAISYAKQDLISTQNGKVT
jgi:AbiV family abortive infection protein